MGNLPEKEAEATETKLVVPEAKTLQTLSAIDVSCGLPFGSHQKLLPWVVECQIWQFASLEDLVSLLLTSRAMCSVAVRFLSASKHLFLDVRHHHVHGCELSKLDLAVAARCCRSLISVTIEGRNAAVAKLALSFDKLLRANHRTLQRFSVADIWSIHSVIGCHALTELDLTRQLRLETDKANISRVLLKLTSANFPNLTSLAFAAPSVDVAGGLAQVMSQGPLFSGSSTHGFAFAAFPLTSLTCYQLTVAAAKCFSTSEFKQLTKLHLTMANVLESDDATIANYLGLGFLNTPLLAELHVQMPSAPESQINTVVWKLPSLTELDYSTAPYVSPSIVDFPVIDAPKLQKFAMSRTSQPLKVVKLCVSAPQLTLMSVVVRFGAKDAEAAQEQLCKALQSGAWPDLQHLEYISNLQIASLLSAIVASPRQLQSCQVRGQSAPGEWPVAAFLATHAKTLRRVSLGHHPFAMRVQLTPRPQLSGAALQSLSLSGTTDEWFKGQCFPNLVNLALWWEGKSLDPVLASCPSLCRLSIAGSNDLKLSLRVDSLRQLALYQLDSAATVGPSPDVLCTFIAQFPLLETLELHGEEQGWPGFVVFLAAFVKHAESGNYAQLRSLQMFLSEANAEELSPKLLIQLVLALPHLRTFGLPCERLKDFTWAQFMPWCNEVLPKLRKDRSIDIPDLGLSLFRQVSV